MSTQLSYLSQAGYGYDTIVAVSQIGVNSTFKNYYTAAKGKSPTVTAYFIKDSSGNAVQVDQATLLAQTNGIDPLTVTSAQSAQIAALKKSPFYFAFSFIPGDPASVASWNYNYLKFIPGTQKVIYTLCCRTIQLAFYDTVANNWVNDSQTSTLYSINSTITLQNVLNNDNLPPNVQQELEDMGNAGLSVYQLLFDMDTAVVDPSTNIPVLENNNPIFAPLAQNFITAYLNASNAVVAPVLNYSITQPNSATLTPTSLNFCFEQLVDDDGKVIAAPTLAQQNLSTLNYLFATGGKPLPPVAQINWNWLDEDDYQGAMAVNRNTLAHYFDAQLKSYVYANCWVPGIEVGNLMTGEYRVDINTGLYNPSIWGVQAFNINDLYAGSPDTLVQYIFTAKAEATGWATTDTMTVTTYFELTLNVDTPTDNPLSQTLTLGQSLWIMVDATGNAGIKGNTPYNGAPIKKLFTDVFTIGIGTTGDLVFTNSSSTVDDQSDSSANVPEYVQQALGTYVTWAAASSFTQVPISMPKQFVFPGGTTFTFKNAGFSQYSDLVCNITYNAVS